MAFIDYYAVLNLPRDASEQEVDMAFFSLIQSGTLTPDEIDEVLSARQMLADWRERTKYDQKFGYPMAIQSESMPMMNTMCYQLTKPREAIGILLSIKDDFIQWVTQKTELTWQEAEAENYGYDLQADISMPYLILRFPRERERVNFAKKLVDERKIKA